MPSSANLSFVDDGFSDELTSTDGYFHHGETSSPNNMAREPSIPIDSKPEPKTLIAPPQHSSTGGTSRSPLHLNLPRSPVARNYASPPPRLSPSSTPHVSYGPPSPTTPRDSDDTFSENNSLVIGPPPAYSATPVSVVLPQEVPERRYRTFPEQERGFFPLHGPQSMGAPIDDFDGGNAVPRRSKSPIRKAIEKIRKVVRKALLVFLLFVGAFTILGQFLFNRSSNMGRTPIDDSPVLERPIDAEDPYCPTARYKDDQITYEFQMNSDLTVVQTTHDNEGCGNAQVSTVGEIRLRRIPEGSTHGDKPYFTIDAHVSDKELEILKIWDEDSRLLKVSTPKYAKLERTGRHCISLELTAWFPEGAKFSNLTVDANSLTLRVMEDINIDISGRSKFTTISGDVWFPTIDDDSFYRTQSPNSADASQEAAALDGASSKFNISPISSRRVVIETVSGSIKGAYPLMDLLAISSQSGSIDIKVYPKQASETAPAPADLEIQSSSGSIKAYLPIANFGHPDYAPPARNYITRVHSNSGSIDGSYYLGSETNFKSISGSIKITALPLLQAQGAVSTFETHTVSGSTHIAVIDPIFILPVAVTPNGDNDPHPAIPAQNVQGLFTIDKRAFGEGVKYHLLKSVHSSTTASVQVYYPDAWEGTMHAKTVSGSIKTFGEGIRIIKQRKGYGYSELLVRRRVQRKEDGCMIDMTSVTGSLQFSVGA